MSPRHLILPALLASLATPLAAQGLDRQARAWAATCSTCHGSEGSAQGAIPALVGRRADELLRALAELKSNQRPAATVMHQPDKGYTDTELQRSVQIFAAWPVR